MPKKIETLCDNEWLSLKNIVYPERDINGYVFSHEKRCQGKIIVILPFKVEERGMIMYLLRSEVTPCWHIEKPITSSITGGFEKEKGLKKTVIMELKEEGGYTVKEEELIELGVCRGTKSCDTVYHLFSVNLTTKKQREAKGDGSVLEAKAKCFWSLDLEGCEDPLAYVCYYRLNKKFIENLYNKNI
jgi:hypothetical protein